MKKVQEKVYESVVWFIEEVWFNKNDHSDLWWL